MDYDIIIIGAGAVGLSFAKAMAKTDRNILVIEKQPESIIADPSYDGREIAIIHPSVRIMKLLGMWDAIPQDNISSIKEAKVLNGNSPYALDFSHDEVGEENLGYLISNNYIRKSAYDAAASCVNVTISCDNAVTDIGSDDKKAWVTLEDGQTLEAPVVVAADSRFSKAREMMGIEAKIHDFKRTSIVCTMKHELPHNDTAYECFNFDRTVAVLPRTNGNVAAIITVKSEETDDLLAMDKQAIADDVARRIEYKFGRMSLSSDLHPYPLVSTMAKTFHVNRFALIGDAATGMHPVTAQGFNLGLRGAQTLAENLTRAYSRSNENALQKAIETYSRTHRRHSLPLYHGTNALVSLYSNEMHTAKFARRALLHLGNIAKPAKQFMMNHLGKDNDTENAA